MATFRRALAPGASYFFTVVTHRRLPLLVMPEVRAALKAALQEVKQLQPFEQDALVLLPDHLHAIWTLPPEDCDYARRWARIKLLTSRAVRHVLPKPETTSALKRNELGLWQRRFWEHQIRDEHDYQRHMHYLHFNPVKHGQVSRVVDWPYSSFHRWMRAGVYSEDWGAVEVIDASGAAFGEPLA